MKATAILRQEMETRAAAQGEALLREQEAKYRSVIDSIDVGFCIIELAFDADQKPVDYRFLEVNPAFERQTGLSNVVGQWIRSLVPGHEQHWFDIYGAVALSGEPVRVERPAQELSNRWYEVYAFRVMEPGQRQVAILFNDITERKRSEGALERAYQEMQQMSIDLRRSNEDLNQFAQVAGHDLQAPVRSIVQFAQLISSRQKDVLDSETKELLGHIIESGKRMGRLLDDLLRYATFSQGPLAPSTAIWVGAACLQAADNLRIAIEESEATIDCQLEPEVTVRVELSLLTLVFQNLIGNAINYRRNDAKPEVRIWASSEDKAWRFAVRDNGEGIEMRFTHQIFEPFRRLHGKERPGSGVGLATCKRIIERAEGRIWVDSRVGDGSTFYFELPKVRLAREE